MIRRDSSVKRPEANLGEHTDCVTYICLLNWNGWQDTVGCIESLLRLEGGTYKILVCDNDSKDASVSHIEQWARGEQHAPRPEHKYLQSLYRDDSSPVAYQTIPCSDVLSGEAPAAGCPLTIIVNDGNLGFAGGNNRGIQYALMQEDMTHLWLLNNDTLVEPDCLQNMHRRLAEHPRPAVVGSKVMFFDDPGVVQTLGGNQFNPLTGIASASLGRFLKAENVSDTEDFRQSIEQSMDYITGCSMLLPRQYLEAVGLMEESYFLYYEEIDWAVRSAQLARKNELFRFDKLIAFDAVLYHREGASIGSASLQQTASLQSEYYMFRSKLLFTRRHYPWYLVPVCAFCLLQALNRLRQARWRSFKQILSLLLMQFTGRLENQLAAPK